MSLLHIEQTFRGALPRPEGESESGHFSWRHEEEDCLGKA
jgi:hypothetical protein